MRLIVLFYFVCNDECICQIWYMSTCPVPLCIVFIVFPEKYFLKQKHDAMCRRQHGPLTCFVQKNKIFTAFPPDIVDSTNAVLFATIQRLNKLRAFQRNLRKENCEIDREKGERRKLLASCHKSVLENVLCCMLALECILVDLTSKKKF